MTPYARHLFICTGQYCDPAGEAQALYDKLPHMLGELARYRNPERVKRGMCPCLGVCQNGPIVVVYPDGVWYQHVDEVGLKRIVDEHLKGNKPVEDLVFHRLVAADDETIITE